MSVLNENLLLGAAAAGGYSIDRSLRFNSADSAYLSRTPASAGNRKTWTWAGWVKRSGLGTYQSLFNGINSQSYAYLHFASNNTLAFEEYGRSNFVSSAVFRDTSAWMHITLTYDTTNATAADRIKIFVNGVRLTSAYYTAPTVNTDGYLNQATAHDIGRFSFNYPTYAYHPNAYLADIHFCDGTAYDALAFGETDATTGVWVPKAPTGLTYGTNGFHLDFADNSSAAALGYDAAGSNDWTVNNISATSSVNYTSRTSLTAGTFYAGRGNIRNIYDGIIGANGSPLKFIEFDTHPATLTFSPAITSSTGNVKMYVASYYGASSYTATLNGSTSYSFTSVPAEGTAAALYDLGVTTLSSITFPTGGSPAMRVFGIVANNALLFDGTAGDSFRDSPTNGTASTGGDAGGVTVGNYCTINPLGVSANTPTISDGNLQMTLGSQQAARLGTIGVTSGKWYWEIVYTAATAFDGMVGVARQAHNLSNYVGSSSDSWGYYYNGVKYNAGSATSYGSSWTTGDVIGVALDMDNLALYFSKNGTWQNSGVPTSGASKTGAAYTNLSGEIFPALNAYGGTQVANFGQRAFAYTAPSGFKALCTANLPAPTIVKPSTVMDVVLYTGTGSALTPTSTLGFNPDLVWIKGRSGATDHALYDAVRGVEKRLESNNSDAEVTSDGGVTAFNSAGFSVGTLAQVNTSSATYAGWCWDAGTSNATNTSGTITSTVRANATAGFSVITYTGNGTSGATVGHGLGVAPSLIIVKKRSAADDWVVYHSSLGATKYLVLQLTDAEATSTTRWNNTAPTSSVFSLGNASSVNGNTATFVAYAWAPVTNYSAMGSYTGDGTTNGPFVYTGFRPRWVMYKRTDSTSDWFVLDSARDSYNVAWIALFPNSPNAEITDADYRVDFLANGFKIRTTTLLNTSSATYVWAAFAESPFGLNNRAR